MELKHLTWESSVEKKTVCALIRWWNKEELEEAHKILNKQTFPIAALHHLINSKPEKGSWAKFTILRNERGMTTLNSWDIRRSREANQRRFVDRIFNHELQAILNNQFQVVSKRLEEPESAHPLLKMFVHNNYVLWPGYVLKSWFKLKAVHKKDGKEYALMGHGKGGRYKMFEIYKDSNLGPVIETDVAEVIENFDIIPRNQPGYEAHNLPANLVKIIKDRNDAEHKARYSKAAADKKIRDDEKAKSKAAAIQAKEIGRAAAMAGKTV